VKLCIGEENTFSYCAWGKKGDMRYSSNKMMPDIGR
jgi:hypothetical protein